MGAAYEVQNSYFRYESTGGLQAVLVWLILSDVLTVTTDDLCTGMVYDSNPGNMVSCEIY